MGVLPDDAVAASQPPAPTLREGGCRGCYKGKDPISLKRGMRESLGIGKPGPESLIRSSGIR